MKKDLILAIIRHSLTFVGGLFITKGVIDEEIVSQIVGGTVSLTSVIWMTIDKIKNNK